jgi:hypothetical protein
LLTASAVATLVKKLASFPTHEPKESEKKTFLSLPAVNADLVDPNASIYPLNSLFHLKEDSNGKCNTLQPRKVDTSSEKYSTVFI